MDLRWRNLEGKKIGAAEATGLEIAFEVKGDRLFLFSKGKIKGTYSLKLGPHKSPREIDTVEVEGPAPGTKSRGIYALEGETLKLCLRDKLNGRPGTFTVAEGSDDMYWLLRRELPKVFVYQRSLAARMLGFAVSPVVQAAVVEGHKNNMPTPEHRRLVEIRDDIHGWRRWGPYVSDRAWATVREDYSPDGDAWEHLPHDLARSKAYRWGEDGIAGSATAIRFWCFAPAFWNTRDPILKERLFGLTPNEANHGEDVKEYYFYLDNTPTHSYMKFLYKYPQTEFPYAWLIWENRNRHGQGFEFELLDTGIFDHDRYFDIFIEYAKADPEDMVVRIDGRESRPRAGAAAHPAAALVSQYLGLGTRTRCPSRQSGRSARPAAPSA